MSKFDVEDAIGSIPSHTLYRQRPFAMPDTEVVNAAVAKDPVASRIRAKGLHPADGDYIGVRLNLNILKSQGVAVHTLHKGSESGIHKQGRGYYNREVIGYSPIVTLRHVFFNVNQAARESIASGAASKTPMASIDGTLSVLEPHSFDGIEVRMNPKFVHLFVDEHNRAVRYAEVVTIHGHRAYARGRVEYFTYENVPAKGPSPSLVVIA